MKLRIQLAIGAAICMAVLVIGIVIWADRMTPVTIAVAPMPEVPIRVVMSGAVATPGIVEAPPGARLQEVVDAAGGFLPDADVTSLNLAGRVGDGEQVHIPSMGSSSGESPSPSPSNVEQLININTASAEELQELPGIGEVISDRIVAYRDLHGPFSTVDELGQVDGISERMVEELRPLVTVSPRG